MQRPCQPTLSAADPDLSNSLSLGCNTLTAPYRRLLLLLLLGVTVQYSKPERAFFSSDSEKAKKRRLAVPIQVIIGSKRMEKVPSSSVDTRLFKEVWSASF